MAAIKVYWPGFVMSAGNVVSLGTFTIDQTTDALEFVFAAEEDATVTHLGFRYSAKGAGTPPQYTIALKDVASGVPGSTTHASGTFTPPNDATWNGTFQWIALSASYAVARGSQYAITISTAGTPNSDLFNTNINVTNAGPRLITNNNGTRTLGSTTPIYGYKSASAVYGLPVQTISTVTYQDTTAVADEYGIKFSLPAGIADTYKVAGVRLYRPAFSNDLILTLYDADGSTVLQQITIAYPLQSMGGGQRNQDWFFDEATLAALACGSQYRLTVRHSGATGSLYNLEQASAADFGAWPGGTDFVETKRVDNGAWTDTATIRPFIDLILADITEPTGGGGGIAVLTGGGLAR